MLSSGGVTSDRAINVLPARVSVAGTLRTMDESWRAAAKQRITEVVDGVCSAYGVTAEIDAKDGFPMVVNDPGTTGTMRLVAEELVGKDHVVDLEMRMTAEDFGFYTQRFPAVFYRLGVGFSHREADRLHSSTFIANEEAISHGIALMVAGAFRFLKES